MKSLVRTSSLLLALTVMSAFTAVQAEDDHSSHSGGKGKGSHSTGGGHSGGKGGPGNQGSGYTHDSQAAGSKSVEHKIFESEHGKGPKYMGGGASGDHTDKEDGHDGDEHTGEDHQT